MKCNTCAFQPPTDCSEHALNSLPPTLNISVPLPPLTEPFLTDVYKSFFSLSAHVKFMEHDWTNGRNCLVERQEMARPLRRLAVRLMLSMCLLMKAHPVGSDAPYPPPHLRQFHTDSLDNLYYHYYDCSGRLARDCLVLNHVDQLLGKLERGAMILLGL